VAAVEAGADRDVLARVEQADSAVTMRRAAEAYQRGDQQAALELIESKRQDARRKAAKYKLKDEDLAPVYESLEAMGAGMAATPAAEPAPSTTKDAKARAYKLAK
jgi:hypothetical protein